MAAARIHRALAGWTFVCVVSISYASLLPFDFRSAPSPSNAFGLRDLRFAGASAEDIRTNLLVYLPVGLPLGYVFRRRATKRLTVLGATLCGALLSTTLECLQTCLPSRVGSWMDIGLNVAGTSLGAIMVVSLVRFARAATARVRCELHERPLRLAASALTLGLFVYNVAPFDFVATTGELHESFSRAKWSLVAQAVTSAQGPLDAPAGQIGGALWFAGLGYVLALAGLEARRHPLVALVSAAKNGMLLAVLAETMQLFTCSHVFDLGAIFLRAVGVVLGGWSAVFLVEGDVTYGWPRAWKSLAPTSVLVLLAMVQIALLVLPTAVWSYPSFPFEAGGALPFEKLWRCSATAALGDILATVAAYAVLAWTLAVIARRGGVRTPVLAVGLAVSIVAVGQTVLESLSQRGSDPATPILALLSAVVAVRLERAVRTVCPDGMRAAPFHAKS